MSIYIGHNQAKIKYFEILLLSMKVLSAYSVLKFC